MKMTPSPDFLMMTATLQMPLMKLPVRSTAIHLTTGVVLLSPISRLTEYLEDLEQFGQVTDIVAPSLFHHLSVPLAIEAFPQARVWGVPGLNKKRPDVSWTHSLDLDSWTYQEELQIIPLLGLPNINEVVFYHVRTKTLFVIDLCFHLRNQAGFGPRLILSLFGTYNKFGVSRFFLRMVKDRKSFENSLREILALDFENLVMCHGEPIWGGAKSLFTKALRERGLSF